MASVNKTVRDVAAKMSAAPKGPKGPAHRITVQKAKGGYITETEHNMKEPYYEPAQKAVHKTLSSVKSHMAHAFNDADADEA